MLHVYEASTFKNTNYYYRSVACRLEYYLACHSIKAICPYYINLHIICTDFSLYIYMCYFRCHGCN